LRRASLLRAVGFVGLGLLLVGLSMLANAHFGPGEAIFGAGSPTTSQGNTTDSFTVFLKPTDRMLLSYSSNSSDVSFDASIIRLATGSTMLQEGVPPGGSLQVSFSPSARGAYLVRVNVSSSSSNQQVSSLVSIYGGTPSDFETYAYLLIALGAAMALLWIAESKRGRAAGLTHESDRQEYLTDGQHGHRTFFVLLKWELFSSRKVFFGLLVFFLMMYSAGGFTPNYLSSSIGGIAPTIADLFNPTLRPTSDWFNLFPIVVAVSAYSFSYEQDKLILRSLKLNPIRSATIFASKVCALLAVTLVPIAVALGITLALYDPRLFLGAPLLAWGNLPMWVEAYVLYGFVMVGISLLPAVFFDNAVYAFVAPVFVSFLIQTEGFGLYGAIPSDVWTTVVGMIQSYRDWGAALGKTLPAVILATVFLAISLILFEVKEGE